MIIIRLLSRSVIALVFWCLSSQEPNRFEAEIRAFEKQDEQTPPPARPILFTGSSSIAFWKDLPQYFPDKVVLQRGFGGSDLSDVRYFADRIIVRYQPRQIVLYAGENDIASGKLTARQTCQRFVDLFQYVRQQLPSVRFTYLSIKPSPVRRPFWPVMNEANRLIRRFLKRQRNAQFVDIRPVMLDARGQTIGALFRPDSLHMTPLGYQRWAPVLRPYLD